MALFFFHQVFCAPVDGPALIIDGDTFYGGIEIITQPTYGRVLFTEHDILVRNCTFYGWGTGAALRLM